MAARNDSYPMLPPMPVQAISLETKLTDAKFCYSAGLIDTINPTSLRAMLLDDIGARTE
jgi:hypothetical protein